MVNTLNDVEVVPTGAAVGAEVRGLDFAQKVPKEVAVRVNEVWAQHKVLLLRNQFLDKSSLYQAAEVLGGVQETGSRAMNLKAGWKEGTARISDFPGISYISNLDENGEPVLRTKGSGSLEIGWHTDNSYMQDPPMGSLLNAVEVPVDGGGHTSFLDTVAAYESMTESLKLEIEGLHMCHDNSHSTVGQLRAIYNGVEPTCREEVDGPVHPLVRIHPITGKRSIYLSRRHGFPSAYIVELSDAESEDLQDRIWAHVAQDKFTWTHTDWKVGDLVMWDNQQLLHKRSAIDPTQKRVMQRTLVKSEGFISAWDSTAAAE
ncbi:MAG: taurine catabolism dioxygenase [Rhodospirillaceae bacterium]|nr:taurine catabolism dioxygenase [Rhodospirillaceae bacterium]